MTKTACSVTRLALAAVSLFGAGCSGSDRLPTSKVTGTVTIDGVPLRSGALVFVPDEAGPTAQGKIAPDGTYSMMTYEEGDGVVFGNYKVMIIAYDEGPPVLAEEVRASNNSAPKALIPQRYGDTTTSGLTAEVGGDEVVKNFELTTKPEAKPAS